MNEHTRLEEAARGEAVSWPQRGREPYSLEGGRLPPSALSGSEVAAWKGVSSAGGGKDPEPSSLLAAVTLSITAQP